MKRVLFILCLIFMSCSEEEMPEELTTADLLGTWEISSINGNSDLDSCDREQSLKFTETALYVTSSYWGDSSMEEDCEVFTTQQRYRLEGNDLDIKYTGGDVHYYVDYLSQNKIKIRSSLDDISNTYTYTR